LQRLAMLRQAMEREALEAEHARTESALLRDPLTGLGNRLRFDRIMAAVDAGSWDRPTSLLVLDVDRFKAINDTYSHAAGDEILCAIAGVLRASCRTEQDVAVRYAGDEFAVFLQGTTAAAVDVADRIMSAVRTTDVRHVAPGLRLSVSIGVASLAPGMTARELFRAADAQMYRSKRAGRGRVSADGSA